MSIRPDRIDRYEVLDELGSGGFARVYQVLDPLSRDVLALKWLLAEDEFEWKVRPQYPEYRWRFIEEAKTLQRLVDIPGVVRCHGLGQVEGRPYYTMDIFSSSLADVLGELKGQTPRALEVEEMTGYVGQVLRVLVGVHGQGVIHRDLTSANVLLQEGEVRLGDFGLAKREGGSRLGQTSYGQPMGSMYYAAPEQMTNAELVDERADLYPVGVMLYRGLSGQYPVGAVRALAELSVGGSVGGGLSDLVMGLLSQDPDGRPGSAGEALARLERAVGVSGKGGQKKPDEPEESGRAGDVSEQDGAVQVAAPGGDEERPQGDRVPRTRAGGQEAPAVRTGPKIADDPREESKAHAVRLRDIGVEVLDDVPLAVRNAQDAQVGLWIPAGAFQMGSKEEDRDERPVHEVHVDAFHMDKYAVTNASYAGFVAATGHRSPECAGSGKADWNRWSGGEPPEGYGDHPVVDVSWDDAVAYCEWAGKRLPTEAEWEKTARGTDGRAYPWGDEEADYRRAVMDDGGGNGCGEDRTWPVGSKPLGASPYGVHDMSGNVWEWVSDWYEGEYYSESPSRNPEGPSTGSDRVLRGGSWGDAADHLRAAGRPYYLPVFRHYSFGFRCARASDRGA